eukprot:scaffold58_cov256-Pinguiococcus_pyrenoidosus.AAC.6
MSDQDDFELAEEAPSGATQDPAPCQDLVSATAADENSFLPAGFKPAAFVGTTETCRDGAESLTQALHRLLHGRTWSSLAKPQGIVKVRGHNWCGEGITVVCGPIITDHHVTVSKCCALKRSPHQIIMLKSALTILSQLYKDCFRCHLGHRPSL